MIVVDERPGRDDPDVPRRRLSPSGRRSSTSARASRASTCFIGEEDAIGRGLGPEILRAFISEVVFAQEGTHAVVAGVEPENMRSLRAFEKAGFRFAFDYEEDGRPHTLLRCDRA